MKNFLAIIAFFCAWNASAAEPMYAVKEIPDALQKNANVVIRSEIEQYHLHSLTEAVYKRKVAITILNPQGSRYAPMVVQYSKFSKVVDFDGALYNGDGQLLQKLKSRDISDHSSISNISLMEDSRVKVHSFEHITYPYTVEYEISIKYNSTFYLPRWTPQGATKTSVQYSSFLFAAPADYKVQFRAVNYNREPVAGMQGKFKTLFWETKDIPVIEPPFASPSWEEITMHVTFSPSEFEMEGYKGSVSSWNELGKFQATLHKGRDQLPENIINDVKDIAKAYSTDFEKVRAIFQYLQKNTRYISIQLGIGGWQPFEASFVASKGYGDCKALSNYMHSLLKAVGIKSNYVLINGGSDSRDKILREDFPSNQFNHMVLCVPMVKDTMWLECTSQTDPAGYMGGFTGNRKALMVTETGGTIVSTPRYGLKENLSIRKINGVVNTTGKMEIDVHSIYKNLEQDRLNGILNNLSKDKVKEYLQEAYDEMGTYSVNSFNHEIKKAVHPEIEEHLDLTALNYATISGKRMFIVPNIMNRQGLRLTVDTSRRFDFVFDAEYKNEDLIHIEIPEGYELESPFQNINISSEFGKYAATVKVEGNQIIYHRIREQFSGRFSPSAAEKVAKYYNDIYKADRARMVFVKKAE